MKLKEKIIKLITEENFDKHSLNKILEYVEKRRKEIPILNKKDEEGNLYYLVHIDDEHGDEGAYWLYATLAKDEEEAIKNTKKEFKKEDSKNESILEEPACWNSLIKQLARLQYQLKESHIIAYAPKYINQQKIGELKYIGEPIKE